MSTKQLELIGVESLQALQLNGVAVIKGKDGTTLTVNNTAAIGQTIKIAAVDETGQPTAWEAINMPVVEGGSVSIDATLTVEGAAADAKATGDAISSLSSEIDNIPGGKDGADGQDGIGIESVVQTTTSTVDSGINVVTVTKTDGTTSTFEVRNGSTGQAGADGYTPVRGTDYWTAEDQQAIVDAVLDALPAAEGVSY